MKSAVSHNLRLRKLKTMALRFHGTSRAHAIFTLGSMAEHVVEVCRLIERKDSHWKAETVDILIHCHLLLQAAGVSPAELDGLLSGRIGRFEQKITNALLGKAEHK